MDRLTGKRAALTSALESRLRDIYSYFRRLGVDAASAEDLVQETFVIAWQGLAGLRDESKLKAWLYGIAYRQYLKGKHAAASLAAVEVIGELAAGPRDNPGSDDRLRAHMVCQALRTLPDDYLHPVVLLYWEELSYQEAARVLALPIGTLAWRVHKALKLLRRALAEEGAENETESPESQGAGAADSLGEG